MIILSEHFPLHFPIPHLKLYKTIRQSGSAWRTGLVKQPLYRHTPHPITPAISLHRTDCCTYLGT